jgi:hypothetical protein
MWAPAYITNGEIRPCGLISAAIRGRGGAAVVSRRMGQTHATDASGGDQRPAAAPDRSTRAQTMSLISPALAGRVASPVSRVGDGTLAAMARATPRRGPDWLRGEL